MGKTVDTVGSTSSGTVTLTLSAEDAQALLTALTNAVHGSVGGKSKPPKPK
ncbi:MAG TPA: hypothetical protein VGL72_25345 [Bryobacteraceae bacterium]